MTKKRKDKLGPPTPSPFNLTEDQHQMVDGAVDSIVSDIGNRSGLDSQWDAIDKETRDEILEAWRRIVSTALVIYLGKVEPRDDEGDLLVNLGDMTGFNLDSLKKIMSGGVDNNHADMVEEHIKVFNYAITQGIHPGQALLAGVQAIGSLLGFAIRSGMHQNVGSALTALLIKTTGDSATQVQIVTTN